MSALHCSRSVDRQLQMRQRKPARRLGRRHRQGRRDRREDIRDGRNGKGRNALGRRCGDTGRVAAVHGVCTAAGTVHRPLRPGRARHGGGSRRSGRLRGCMSRRRHGSRRRCRPADKRVHAEETHDQQRSEHDELQPVPSCSQRRGRAQLRHDALQSEHSLWTAHQHQPIAGCTMLLCSCVPPRFQPTAEESPRPHAPSRGPRSVHSQ